MVGRRRAVVTACAVLAASVPAVGLVRLAAPGASSIGPVTAPPTGRIVVDRLVGEGQDLVSLRADGTDEQGLTTSMPSGEAQASLDADASTLAFSSCREDALAGDAKCQIGSSTPAPVDLNVFVMAPAPEDPTGAATKQITTDVADDFDPALAADGDGHVVAFTSVRDGLVPQIYTARLDAAGQKLGDEQRVTSALLTPSTEPAWSADRTRLAFVRNEQIHVLRVAAGPESASNPAVPVTSGAAASQPAWSPVDDRLAFTRDGAIHTITVPATPAGVPPSTLVATDAVDPAWSPDGRHLAFASSRPTSGSDVSGDAEIYTVAVAGGDVTRVTANAADDRRPTWAEDLAWGVDRASVAASPAAVPVDQVPLQAGSPAVREAGLLDIPDLELAPLDIQDLELAPLDIQDLELAPLDIQELELAGLLDIPDLELAPLTSKALDQISLAVLPLRDPAGGWDEVLAGTSLVGPAQSFTLGDVRRAIADDDGVAGPDDALLHARLRAIGPPDLDYSVSPLGNVSVVALLLGHKPFRQLGTGIDLCGSLTTLGYRCADLGAEPSTDPAKQPAASVLSLQLAGVPLNDPRAPLTVHRTLLSSMDLTGTPIVGMRLFGLDLTTELGDVRIADVPAAARDRVVACDAVDCSDTSTETLHTASRSGALRRDGTFGELGPATGHLRVADAVLALLDRDQYPLDDVEFDRLGIDRWNGPTSTSLTYTARYSVVGRAGVGGAAATLTLPGRFLVIPDSVTVDGATVPATVTDDESTTTLVVPLGDVAAGTPVTVSARVRPGTRLQGPAGAAVSIASDDAAAAEQRTGAAAAVVEAHESNDTLATATPVAPGTLYVSHTSGPDDGDLFALPVEANTTYTARLAHTAVDRDLFAYATAADPHLRAATDTGEGVLAVTDDGADLENATDAVQADPADDLDVLEGVTVLGISANRGASPETVRIVADRAGTVYLHVAPYLGATDDRPYTLTIVADPLPALPPCAARTFAHDAAPFSGDDEDVVAPDAVTADTRTLLLVNRDRIRDTYGPAAADEVMASLRAVADLRDAAGAPLTRGAVVTLDSDAGFRAAEAAWVADPCSIDAANAVVRAANDVVDRLRSGSGADIDDIVITGDDLQIPFSRLRDRTVTGNEATFAASAARITGNAGNPLLAAFARGRVLSDAPYAAFRPIPWLGSHLYRPGGDVDDRVAIGRLIETPAEIVGQLQAFVAVRGAFTLDGPSLVAADDFMIDAGRAMDVALEALIGAPQADLLTTTWTAAALLSGMFPASGTAPDLVALGAHADPTRLQAADGSVASSADLLARGSLAGRLLWAISCHFGTPVADLVAAPGTAPAPITEWAQAASRGGATALLAQTGFGIGIQPGVGLTERLAVDFARRLRAGTGIGESAEETRSAYLDEIGAYGVYDEKVLHQFTLYGLPMYGRGPQAPPPAAPSDSAGVATQTFDIAPRLRLVTDSERGSTYEADGEPPLAVHSRPLQPSVRRRITTVQARGAMVRGIGGSFDRTAFDPVHLRPHLAGSGDGPEPAYRDVRFPANPVEVSRDGRTLVANLGVFRSSGLEGGRTVGLQRIYTQMRVEAGGPLDPRNPDRLAPRITAVTSSETGTAPAVTATVTVSVLDRLPGGATAEAAEVQAVVLDDGGSWRVIALERIAAGTWRASFPVTGRYEFMVEARDGVWNVGRSSAKAGDFSGSSGPPAPPTEAYRFVGPHPPSSAKEIKAGSTVPVKFEVFKGTTEIVDPRVVTALWFYRVPCAGEAPVADEAVAGNPADVIFDGEQLRFTWKTDSSWANTCRAVQIELDDGRAHRVLYSMRP